MSGAMIPPLNAPPAGYGGAGGVNGIGIQPGTTTGIVTAQYVIVSGGTASGVFVYQGTPGHGNGPIAWMTSGTTDPYGNPVTPGVGATEGALAGTIINEGSIPQSALNAAITARSLGGITTTISSSEPENPNDGDIWIDEANGYQLQQYGTSGWQPITWTATDVISAGTITASLIEAGTITASLLAAGIIVAGIIDGTTVSAATFEGSTFEGTDFIINTLGAFFYSSSPGTGNLSASITPASGSNDGQGNSYDKGLTVYAPDFPSSNGYINISPFNTEALIAISPTFTAPSGSGVTWYPPQINTAATNSGEQSIYFSLQVDSGNFGSTGNTSIIMYGNSPDGTTSHSHISFYAEQSSSSSTGTTWTTNLVMDMNGTGLHAADPSGGNINETWHTMAGFSTGYGHGSPAPSYKLYPDNTVGFAGVVNVSASAGSNEIVPAFGSSPYYPETDKRFMCASTASDLYAEIIVNSSGELQLASYASYEGASVYLDGIRYPLDY